MTAAVSAIRPTVKELDKQQQMLVEMAKLNEALQNENQHLRTQVEALIKQRHNLQNDFKQVIQQNEKFQLLALLEKTEKLKLQEQLSNLVWLQNDEKHIIKLIDQKFREFYRMSASHKLSDIVKGAKPFNQIRLGNEDGLVYYISKQPFAPKENQETQTDRRLVSTGIQTVSLKKL